MASRVALSQSWMAEGDRLSDVQLGLLLDALQLGTRVVGHPEHFREALALFRSW